MYVLVLVKYGHRSNFVTPQPCEYCSAYIHFPPAQHFSTPSRLKLEKKRAAPLNAASEAFQKCSADLTRGIQDPELLTRELYSDDVVSETVVDEVRVVGLSDVQRKMRLLNAVRAQITVHPAKFQNLLRALRRQPSLKDVAEKLKTAYESQLEVDGRETELKGVSHCKS